MEGKAVIRPARPDDAPAVARVHVDSWRETYAGLVPGDFLASLSYERREQMWKSGLEHPGWKGVLFVAEDPEHGVAGFVAGGPPQEPDGEFSCELWAIYLLWAHQGKGTGGQLFRRFVEEMVSRGHSSMLLWVLAENHPSRRFYEALGGTLTDRRRTIDEDGVPLEEVAYGWHDLRALG
jgi:ribosomal protein S18 acetylase RimI-like enzyme